MSRQKNPYVTPVDEMINKNDWREEAGEFIHPSRKTANGLTDFDANSGLFDEDVTPVATSLWD